MVLDFKTETEEQKFERIKTKIKVRFKNLPVDWESLRLLVKRDEEIQRSKNQMTY